MKKITDRRALRQPKAVVSRQSPEQTHNAPSDAPDRIEVGDVVATSAEQGGDVGGVVVGVFGEIIVFKTDRGSFDVQDADGLFVVSKAQSLTPAGSQEPITGKTHRFEVGDLVTDANNECPNGIVIAVFRHDFGQGDVVVWMHADGTLSTWYADDVELVARGPVPDAAAAIARRKIDLELPATVSRSGLVPPIEELQALARLIGRRQLHDPENEYEPATLDRMIAAAGKLDRAQMLLQQITDLILSPIQDGGDIGWKWSDEVAADWAAAFINKLRDSIGHLQQSVRCAIAIKANEGTRGAA